MNSQCQGSEIMHIPITICKANFSKQDNAKVKVQYIQTHQTLPVSLRRKFVVDNHADTIIEAENVEYLDESASQEQLVRPLQLNGHQLAVHPDDHLLKEPFKDTFYPNAIHCLIDLYKRKYLQMRGKTKLQIRSMGVWDQIATDMNECLFRFDSSQIKEKFKQLRKRYFGISSSQDADDFEFFDQMHDLYRDKFIDSIAAGVIKREELIEKHDAKYPDADLLLNGEQEEVEESNQKPQHIAQESQKNIYEPAAEKALNVQIRDVDEIEHKEHEFIDMVEKELQAIVEEGDEENRNVTQKVESNEVILHQQEVVVEYQQEEVIEHQQDVIENQQEDVVEHEVQVYTTRQEEKSLQSSVQTVVATQEQEQQDRQSYPLQNAKRFKADPKTHIPAVHVVQLHMPAVQQPLEEVDGRTVIPLASDNNNSRNKEITLTEYNEQQERRHREKLDLLQRSLLLQERAIETHRHLMEELLNRL